MERIYDVIVVGAGPAGATLSRHLAASGIKVLVLDRAVFPRHKCCGGGLTVRAASLLGDECAAIVENSISSAVLAFGGSHSAHGEYDRTVMYTLSREKFDNFLVQKAEESGATILQNAAANGLTTSDTRVEVFTDSGTFQSKFVVGADGAGSVVAGSLFPDARSRVVAIETEVGVSESDLAKWQKRVKVDFGCVSEGYGWLFPKADHLSIGVASLKVKAADLKRSYWQFVRSLDLDRCDIRRWSGGIIPICNSMPVVTEGRVALIGDAAGLADPLTGEGIYNAILSARLAASAIGNSLARGEPNLQAYQHSVEEMILPEIRAARFFARLRRVPKRLLDFARADDRIWRAAGSLLRGETTYASIRDRVGSLGGLHSLLKQR